MAELTGSDAIGGTNQSADNDFGDFGFWFEWIEFTNSPGNLTQAGFDTVDGSLGGGQTVYNAGGADNLDALASNASAAVLGDSGELFGLRVTTTIDITTAGVYTFDVRSDDGVILYVDGVPVVSDDSLHAPRNRDGDIDLSSGQHEITIIYFERTGQNVLEVDIQGPDYPTEIPLQDAAVRANAGADTVTGGQGDDIIDGGDGADSLLGGDNNDEIDGGAGDDVIEGGSGADTLQGGAGSDTVSGDAGADAINDFDGANDIDGGAGDDTIFVTAGDFNNTVSGGADNDAITVFNAATATNVIDGGDGDDTITAGDSNDSITGGGDDDQIFAGDGANTIDGGDGDDTLFGGAGADLQTGGDGFEVFTVTAGDDAITDFNTGAGQDFTDGLQDNNDFLDLAPYYDTFFEARADLDDDGLLNQSNAGDTIKGAVVDYTDNTLLPGTIDLDVASSDDLTFDNINVVCFTAGTRIATPDGERAIETLAAGDLVSTLDNGAQPVRWIGRRRVPARGALAPVRFMAGSLPGLKSDLRVSQQHRMLLGGWRAALYFDANEVLAGAKHLVNGDTVHIEETADDVEYIHILFDRHEIIMAEGALSESLHPGPEALDALETTARRELFTVFPELGLVCDPRPTARPCLKAFEARAFVADAR
ncbi:MAG: Hint domain-containing protein [Pseudomonadota bacterium]